MARNDKPNRDKGRGDDDEKDVTDAGKDKGETPQTDRVIAKPDAPLPDEKPKTLEVSSLNVSQKKAWAYTVHQIRKLLNQPGLLNCVDNFAEQLGFRGPATVEDYDLKSPQDELNGFHAMYAEFAKIGHTSETIGDAASVRVDIEDRLKPKTE